MRNTYAVIRAELDRARTALTTSQALAHLSKASRLLTSEPPTPALQAAVALERALEQALTFHNGASLESVQDVSQAVRKYLTATCGGVGAPDLEEAAEAVAAELAPDEDVLGEDGEAGSVEPEEDPPAPAARRPKSAKRR